VDNCVIIYAEPVVGLFVFQLKQLLKDKKLNLEKMIYMNSQILNYKEQKWLDKELDPDEKVIWKDKPIPKCFTKNTIGTFLFGMLIVPNLLVSDSIGALLSTLIGVGMLSTPLLNLYQMSNTLYVITENRIIIFKKLLFLNISSFENIDKNNVLRKQNEETGDIIVYHWYSNDEDKIFRKGFAFLNIRNVKEVYNYIVESNEKKSPSTAPTKSY